MAKISDLSDELLVKILSYLPTKVAVSTSVLSKQWEFLWMWSPKLVYSDYSDINDSNSSSLLRYRDFIAKHLPLHRAPIIESLLLRFHGGSVQPDDIKSWAGIAVSRCVRELNIDCYYFPKEPAILLPISLYTCKSLVTLKLEGIQILVDVPRMVCLPSLKTLHLHTVKYSNEDSLRLLLSYCPVLEDLSIDQDNNDQLGAVVVILPSLLRLSLIIDSYCSSDGYVIVTPSLKYLKVSDNRNSPSSYLIEHMPELEEADIYVNSSPEKLLVSITSVKRLTLHVRFNEDLEPVYHAGIVFNQLEQFKLTISSDGWSKLIVRLLKDSPNLRVLNLDTDNIEVFEEYEPDIWDNAQSSVPQCLLKSLETFKFEGYEGGPEERDFLIYIFKHARHLKSSVILS
ncbi:putative FBD-associated F-box protein [Cardamine amara subsp. amara]|uniref:FBD-associated F-box protein n=1 Tax=Cardamine amara subsp. amara TaxID=228776 RepID=A0ABD0ZKM8_CARAN